MSFLKAFIFKILNYLCIIVFCKTNKKHYVKKTNYKLSFECEALGLKFTDSGCSGKLDKLISRLLCPPERPVVTGSHAALLEHHVQMWEQGKLILPEGNPFEGIARFLFRTYDIRHERNPEVPMTLESITTETYWYHTPKK